VPVGIPGTSTTGMFGQRPTKTVARMGGASVDDPVEVLADEWVAVSTEYLQILRGGQSSPLRPYTLYCREL
jgi:hypothetical protein